MSDASRGSEGSATVVPATDGGVLVVWGTAAGGRRRLFARRFDAHGTALGPELRLPAGGDGAPIRPDAAPTEGGGFVVTWWDADLAPRLAPAPNGGVRARAFDAAGRPAGAEIVVAARQPCTAGPIVVGPEAPVVAGLRGGGFVVAWTTEEGRNDADESDCQQTLPPVPGRGGGRVRVRARLFGADGAPRGPAFAALAPRRDANGILISEREPAIAALEDGGFLIVWRYQHPETGIFAQRFDASGERAGGPLRLSTPTRGLQDGQTAATLTDGGLVVAWNGPAGVFARRLDPTGLIGPLLRLSTPAGAWQRRPDVAPLPSGGFAAAWIRWSEVTGRSAVVGRLFDPDGTEASPEFAVATGSGLAPGLAVAGGRLWALTGETGPGGQEPRVHIRPFDLPARPAADHAPGTPLGESVNTAVAEGRFDVLLRIKSGGRVRLEVADVFGRNVGAAVSMGLQRDDLAVFPIWGARPPPGVYLNRVFEGDGVWYGRTVTFPRWRGRPQQAQHHGPMRSR